MKNQNIKDFILNLLFPKLCIGCQKEGTYLCPDCKSILEISEHQYCLCNKDPLRIPPDQKNGKCSKCQNQKLAGLYACLPYKEKALTKKLIHLLKYEPYLVKDLAEPLANLVIDHFSLLGKNLKEIFENSILVPIPLDNKKIRRRGYNQSEEIAKNLSEKLGVEISINNLIKIKRTSNQMELPKEKRLENLIGVFKVKDPIKLKNRKVFLIDDVYTTGSTMEECAKVLRQSGAKEAWGIVIARD